jgi:hypothetical protein
MTQIEEKQRMDDIALEHAAIKKRALPLYSTALYSAPLIGTYFSHGM